MSSSNEFVSPSANTKLHNDGKKPAPSALDRAEARIVEVDEDGNRTITDEFKVKASARDRLLACLIEDALAIAESTGGHHGNVMTEKLARRLAVFREDAAKLDKSNS